MHAGILLMMNRAIGHAFQKRAQLIKHMHNEEDDMHEFHVRMQPYH